MHRVDPDPVLGVLDRRGLRHDPHRSLRRVVAHVVAALSYDAADGRYVDDGAAASRLHLRYHTLHAEEYTLGVDVHEPLPGLGAHRVLVVGAADAGVVHEYVDLAVARHRRFDGLRPVGLAGNVEPHEHGVAA